jgi:hypothetical protein
MNKLLVVFIVLAAISLTAQVVSRTNDSTFVYPCIHNDTTTSYNFIGLPLQTDWTTASDLDPSGTNIDAVSWFDETKQTWFTAGHHPALGWANDFPVETGGAYLISAKNDFNFTVTGDSIPVSCYLIPGMNTLILPLEKAYMTLVSHFYGETGNRVNAVYRYLNNMQTWDYAYKSSFGPWINNFAIYPAMPYWVVIPTTSTPVTWPTVSKADLTGEEYLTNSESEKTDPKSSPYLTPRKVYFRLTDLGGNDLIYPEDTDKIKFEAWLEQGTGGAIAVGQVISNNDWDCGYSEANGHTISYLNLDRFTVAYSGNILYIKPVTHNPNNEIYTYVLDPSSSPVFLGFESIIPGSGQPITLDMDYVASPTNTVVTVSADSVSVSWDASVGAVSYDIYSSTDPYGTFAYTATTSQTSWQIVSTEPKKFYYVVAKDSAKKKALETIEVKKGNQEKSK